MTAKITGFHEIVFFPMIYEGNEPFEKRVEEWGCWRENEDFFFREDGLPIFPDPAAATMDPAHVIRYGESVFYHPFVQRFLYGHKDKTTDSGKLKDNAVAKVRIWQRLNGPKAVELRLEDWTKDWLNDDCRIYRKSIFQVPRVSLYWFSLDDEIDPSTGARRDRFGIAILVLEIANCDDPFSVQFIEELLDRFRRIYPPYFEQGKGGRIVRDIRWLDGKKQTMGYAPPTITNDQRCLDWVVRNHNQRNNFPVLEHWRWLLTDSWEEQASIRCLRGMPIMEDERLPLMAWIACEEPRELTRQDFVRLCFADDAGSSSSYPYAPGFLESFERDYCYDRYWVEDPCPPHEEMSTRFLNSGYAFVTVGQDGPGFYSDETSGLLSHFRNHYFLMGLILHFQKTALLAFSDRLSDDVTGVSRQDGDKKKASPKNKAKHTRRQLLHFTSRYWFTDLTSQNQGQELHDLWRKHLRLDALYGQVMQEARELNEWLDMENEQDLAKTTARLTTVATLGLATGLAMATLGADKWLADLTQATTGSATGDAAANLALAIVVWLVLTLLAVRFSGTIHTWMERLARHKSDHERAK